MLVQPLPRNLRKAVELLRSDLGHDWKVDDLARFCQIPRRTLEKHFRSFVGLAPLKFLQAERFDEARRRLLRAPPGTTVTQVAIGCGFNHLGRFALAYRDRHGESPSDTLHRRRVSSTNLVPIRLAAAAERPALAVLPFELTGPRADRVGQISDEIAATLHRTGWIRLVPPPAGRYHLHGRVTDDGTGTLRIRMTLLDRSARRYIWANSSHCAVGDLFGSSDWFSSLAAGALRSVLRDAEIEQAASQDPTKLRAWGFCMRALPAILAADLATDAAPVELLERAIEIAPQDPVPVSLAAWCHGLRAAHHFVDRLDFERGKSLQFASRGSMLCAGDPLSNIMLAAAYSLAFDLTAAEAHARHALAVDGGSAWAWGRLAWVHAYRDEAEDAIECCQIARALAPSDPLGFLWSVGIAAANLELGRHDRAITWYRRALAEEPKAIWVNRFLAPALTLAGKKEEGRQSLNALLRTFPDLTIAQVRMGLPHTPGTWDRFSDGLASLGMRYS